MKTFKLYLSLLLLIALGLSSGCKEEFDMPPLNVPVAKYEANTTIADIKEKYWQDQVNYIDTIKVADGAEPVVIKGTVISSDATGNIYKNLVIQDESGALAMSINANSLYTTYRLGQEIVINLSNMYIGKYAGLQQLGAPDFKEGFGWQTTFMSLEFFEKHAELNGLPNAANIDTISTYKGQPLTIGALPTLPAEIRGMQSQLVRFDDVEFEGGGTLTYSDPNASVSRILKDSNGNSIDVRNSNYATFKNEILPKGKGSVVGILSVFNAKWQLLLRATTDCIGFGDVVEGSKDKPYTVARAIALQGTSTNGWVAGYIVGAVAPEVTKIKSNSDIQWKAGTDLDNTIVIGATPETKDIKDCIVMSLPQGSAMRTALNLATNPTVYKKEVKVKGLLASYMGTYGLTDNKGTEAEFSIDVPVAGGDGTEANPFLVAQLIKGTASGAEKWVSGYIVGWIEGQDPVAGAKFTTPATVSSNILLAASSDVKDLTQCVAVQLVYNTDPRLLLNLMDHPENLGAQVSIKGNVEKYFGMAGLKNTTACKLGDNPNPPVNPSDLRADFETLNGGVSTGFYETFTSTNGWTMTKCSLLIGGTTDANPIFKFIGKVPGSDAWAMAPSMNGKVGAGSSITSPIISTGCGSLTFNYGMAFTETNGIDFRVEIKQNGAIVKTITIKDPAAAKVTQYTHTEAVNIAGNFTMEFIPNSPSNVTDGNKDRVCIYNVSWTAK